MLDYFPLQIKSTDSITWNQTSLVRVFQSRLFNWTASGKSSRKLECWYFRLWAAIKHNVLPVQLNNVENIQIGGCLDSPVPLAAPHSHVLLHLSRQKLVHLLPSVHVCIAMVRDSRGGWGWSSVLEDHLVPTLCNAGSSRALSSFTACIPGIYLVFL